MSADVYSLIIIIFELFSGIDPFPGTLGQIFRAKMSDKKPAMPSDFPSDLKELILKGWSQDPKERPLIDDLKSALKKMLLKEKTRAVDSDQPQSLPDTNSSNKREEKHGQQDGVDEMIKEENSQDGESIQTHGEIMYPSNDERNRLRYFGNLKNGIPSGHGMMAWKDGQIYEGKNGLFFLQLHNRNG